MLRVAVNVIRGQGATDINDLKVFIGADLRGSVPSVSVRVPDNNITETVVCYAAFAILAAVCSAKPIQRNVNEGHTAVVGRHTKGRVRPLMPR